MVPICLLPRRHQFSLKFCYFFWTTFWNDFHGLLALVLDHFLELNLFFPATICIVFSLSFLQVFVDEILIFNIANFVKIVISPRRNTVFHKIDAVATDQAIIKTWPKFWLRRDGRFDKKLHKIIVETVLFFWHDFWRILARKLRDFGVHLRPHYLDSPRQRDFLDPGVTQDQLRSVPERPRVAQTGQNVSQNSPQMAQERPKVCQVQAQNDMEASNSET